MDRFNELTRLYLRRTRDQVLDMERIANTVVRLAGLDAYERLNTLAHGINGSASCFGLPELGRAAAELEKVTSCRLKYQGEPTATENRRLLRAFERFHAVWRRIGKEPPAEYCERLRR